MEEKNRESLQEKKKKKKAEDNLPYCTTAPSAEHARASEDDEPCDDATGGENSEEGEE